MKNVYFLSDAHLFAGHRARTYTGTTVGELSRQYQTQSSRRISAGRHVRLLVRVPHGRAQRLHPLSRQAVRTDGYGRGSTLLHRQHDIWCGDYLTRECGVVIHREPLTTEIYGKEFYLAHGDGLGDPDKKFKLLRTMFHSRTLQTLFSTLHPRWSVEFGLRWAKHSRLKRIDGKEPDYMGENNEHLVLYTKEYLKNHPNINFFIYGHRHIELDLMLSSTARVLILGDWINYFSYAVFDGENLFLEEFIEGETKL